MNRTQIMSKLRKLIGPNADYRHDPKAPDTQERAELRAKKVDAFSTLQAAKERLDHRRRELLADPEYKRLFAEWREAEERHNYLTCKSLLWPISAGRNNGIGLVVDAQGDTWPEVFAKLEAKL